jgi:hypothetical protein
MDISDGDLLIGDIGWSRLESAVTGWSRLLSNLVD